MDIQNLVYTVGAVVLASIPLFGLIFKWTGDKVNELTAHITKIIAALALAGAAIAGLWLHNSKSIEDKKQNVEAVKALSNVPEEHKAARAKTMGIAP